VAKLGGDEAFWKMTDSIFEITTSNDGLDLAVLPTLAEKAGVKRGAFLTCFNSNEMATAVEEDARSGAAAGASGTPYTLVISPKGNVFPISGAFPYAQAKQVIDRAMRDK
jgi:predicted DsbA family dithiol-disulfide isomerase